MYSASALVQRPRTRTRRSTPKRKHVRINDLLSKIHKSIRFVDNSYHPGKVLRIKDLQSKFKKFPGGVPGPPLWGTPFGGPIIPPGADEPFHFFLPSDPPVNE